MIVMYVIWLTLILPVEFVAAALYSMLYKGFSAMCCGLLDRCDTIHRLLWPT